MDAGKTIINEIFHGRRLLRIPFFQRSYVWTQDLWDRFLESMEQVSRDRKEYFFGSIILKQLSTSSSSNIGDIRIVIDGQQRLTTLAIFLKILSYKKGRLEHERFMTMFCLSNGQLAIDHNMSDKEVFESIIRKNELSPIEGFSNLAKAYNFFLDKVDTDNFNLDAILDYVKFVGIDLDDNDDEQAIFDTINSIGVTLTTGELLKNYLFTNDSIAKYNSKWKPVFEADEETLKYWDLNITQGRMIRKNLEAFLYSYLHITINEPRFNLSSSQKERFRSTYGLFGQYKYFIYITNINKDDLIDDLTAYAKIYREYLSPQIINEEIPSSYGIERLNLIAFGLDTTTLIPYILYLLKNQPNRNERNSIAKILESYLMRRLVCKSANNNYSDLFSTSLISAQYLTSNNLKEYFNSKNTDSSLSMPGDDELKQAFLSSILPNQRAKGILYLIETKIRSQFHSTSILPLSKYTLEHLMPKRWNPTTWPIVDPSLSEERNQRLKTLGNLAILPQSLNASIGNNSWPIKVNGDKGLREYASGLETMKWPLTQSEWDEDKITERACWLFSHARVIWNFNHVEYEPCRLESHNTSSSVISGLAEEPLIQTQSMNTGNLEDSLFYISTVGCKAAARLLSNGKMTILKGSILRDCVTNSYLRKEFRSNIIHNNDYCEHIETGYKVKNDLPSMSPSASSGLVQGRSSNGKLDWKDKNGIPLAAYLNNNE